MIYTHIYNYNIYTHYIHITTWYINIIYIQGFPARVKRIHVINAGYLIYMLFALIKPFLPKKIVARVSYLVILIIKF